MQLIALLAIAVAAVWGLVLALRGSLLVASISYLVIAAVFGNLFLQFEVAGLSLSIDRLFLVVLLGGLAVQWKLQATVSRKWSPAEYLLLAFLAILVASTFANDWRRSTPDQDPIVQHLIEGYLIPVLLYVIARRSVCRSHDLTWFYAILGIFGIYLAITAILEVAGVWSLVFPHYIADPKLGIHFGRARGPFLQSVRLGIYLNAAFAAIWIPWVWQQRGARPGILLGLLGCGLIGLGSLLTLTRSIWLGIGAGIVILAFTTFSGRWRRLAIYGILVGALLVIPLKDSLLTFQREYGSQETLESTRMRAVFAYVSWLMFQDHPLAGVGFGHFPHKKDAYLNDRQTDMNLNSIRRYIHHNTYLSLLVELGIVGMAAYLAVLGCWCRLAVRVWRDRSGPDDVRGHALFCLMLMATCLIQMLFHEVSYTVFENGILFLSTGILSSLSASQSAQQRWRWGAVRIRALPANVPVHSSAAWGDAAAP